MEGNIDFEIEFIGNIDEFDNDNSDVIVKFIDGKKYIATFFTVNNIIKILNRYKITGECNYGQYFWCTDMIIVENLNPLILKETIKDLIKNDEFKTAFSFIGEE